MKLPIRLILLIVLIPFLSCQEATGQPTNAEFEKYWYAGDAELSRYELKQVRYGEVHEGDAVLIFVTEPFRTDKQVKYEGGSQDNVESVLKLNLTKKFNTGIYPYSMMSSTFTPVAEGKPTLKVTTTSQEWCGHTFSQLNHRKNKYEGKLYSYFQNEGDQAFVLDDALLEDEIFTKIRLQPESLPTGDIQMIPGSMFLRFKHREYGVERAVATLSPMEDPDLSAKALKNYRITYKDFPRVLEITFESEFPHAIVAWEEHGDHSDPSLVTRAVRTHTLKSAYWGQHDVKDGHLRAKLGLE